MTSDPTKARKLAALGKLRAAYAADLPGKMETLMDCWRAAAATTVWSDKHGELLRLAHTLAGSAGTFGFRRLGEEAKALEEALVLCSQAPASWPSQQAALAERIETLCKQAQAGMDDAPDTDMAEDTPSASPLERTMPENRRILLLEDDALLASSIAEQLGMFGWEVHVTNSGKAARSLINETGPAALIVDVMLPEGALAGLELMQEVMAADRLNVPHVVISSRSDWESRLAAVRSGAAAYLVKPIDIAALEEHLHRITHPDFPPPYRVLVVDDDKALAGHYAETLAAAGMEAIAITDPSHLLEALSEHRPEIVLMDLYMAGCNGIEALQVIRQDQQFGSLPVVFLSTETGLAQQQKAMRSGAEDFLVKPISDANLVMAITVRAERFRELTTLIRRDSLTGLLNHLSFKQRLESEVDRSRRTGESLSLAMIDIDHFKHVNDTHGHPQGDRVIKSLAQLLRKRLRKTDIIGRYGGEEFIVAMPHTPPAMALTILDELRESFGMLNYATTRQQFSCTFSCGVAAFPPLENAASLISSADKALYQAKHAGRNRVEEFVLPQD